MPHSSDGLIIIFICIASMTCLSCHGCATLQLDIVVLFQCVFDQIHDIFNCLLSVVKSSTGVSTDKVDAKRLETRQTLEGTVSMGGIQLLDMLDWLSLWSVH